MAPARTEHVECLVEARPKAGRQEPPLTNPRGGPCEQRVRRFKTQNEALDWAARQHNHSLLVARVRHNYKKIPDDWRAA